MDTALEFGSRRDRDENLRQIASHPTHSLTLPTPAPVQNPASASASASASSSIVQPLRDPVEALRYLQSDDDSSAARESSAEVVSAYSHNPRADAEPHYQLNSEASSREPSQHAPQRSRGDKGEGQSEHQSGGDHYRGNAEPAGAGKGTQGQPPRQAHLESTQNTNLAHAIDPALSPAVQFAASAALAVTAASASAAAAASTSSPSSLPRQPPRPFRYDADKIYLTDPGNLREWLVQTEQIALATNCFKELTNRFDVRGFPRDGTVMAFICGQRFVTAWKILEETVSGAVWAVMRTSGLQGHYKSHLLPHDVYTYAQWAAERVPVAGTQDQPQEERMAMVRELANALPNDYPNQRCYTEATDWLRARLEDLVGLGDWQVAESINSNLRGWAPRPPAGHQQQQQQQQHQQQQQQQQQEQQQAPPHTSQEPYTSPYPPPNANGGIGATTNHQQQVATPQVPVAPSSGDGDLSSPGAVGYSRKHTKRSLDQTHMTSANKEATAAPNADGQPPLKRPRGRPPKNSSP